MRNYSVKKKLYKTQAKLLAWLLFGAYGAIALCHRSKIAKLRSQL
jgi:hypothetical protein